MKIQEMFNLMREYFMAVNRLTDVNEHGENLFDAMGDEARLSGRVAEFLPKFTPMYCGHCVHADGCSRFRRNGVCEEYEVK